MSIRRISLRYDAAVSHAAVNFGSVCGGSLRVAHSHRIHSGLGILSVIVDLRERQCRVNAVLVEPVQRMLMYFS